MKLKIENKLILGITGTIGAGKGTIVEFLLKEKGFKHYSVREILIEEIKQRGMKINRDSMVIVANELRQKHKPYYLIEQLYKLAVENTSDAVIESIRNTSEAEYLKKKKDFVLLAIDADDKIRYDRIRQRKSETDFITYEEFRQNEEREMMSENENNQNISSCIDMADYRLYNDGTKEELYKKLEIIFKEIKNKKENEKTKLG